MKIPFQLVNAAELEALLCQSGEGSEAAVLEAHFSSWDHPLDGDVAVRRHLRGAIQIHPSFLEAGGDEARYYPHYECPQDGNLLEHAELVQELEGLGVSSESKVVVYGTEQDGPMAAARLAWGLLVAGVRSVVMLDGGIDAWVAMGGETVPSVKRAVDLGQTRGDKSVAGGWQMRGELVADRADVQVIAGGVAGGEAKLVDVRRSGEFDGSLTRCYSFFSKSGHVPGAI
ncbi:sulfurtransferase [Rubritalea tangerina]|uniref:Sulfurtransferase n=1 Tax=Rubritalea tangerina TaxID=430798 RepID=A0ABW4Z8V0_9BACT